MGPTKMSNIVQFSHMNVDPLIVLSIMHHLIVLNYSLNFLRWQGMYFIMF